MLIHVHGFDYSKHYARYHPNTVAHIEKMVGHSVAELGALLPPNKTGTALDIGSAFGYTMIALKNLGYKSVEGVDISQHQADVAAKNGVSVEVTNDTTKWLLDRPGKYELITMLDVLEHIPTDKQQELLSAIRGALTDTGRLIIKTPNANSILASRWRYIDYTHHCSFTENSLRFILESAGFGGIDIKAEKGLKRPSVLIKNKNDLAVWRKYLVRLTWFHVFKAECPWENIDEISFELNHMAVAVK